MQNTEVFRNLMAIISAILDYADNALKVKAFKVVKFRCFSRILARHDKVNTIVHNYQLKFKFIVG